MAGGRGAGKFIELLFDKAGSLAAASVSTFFLERPRVTQVASGERSYHLLYQLLAGASPAARAGCKLGAKTAAEFRLTKGSGCFAIAAVCDRGRALRARPAPLGGTAHSKLGCAC